MEKLELQLCDTSPSQNQREKWHYMKRSRMNAKVFAEIQTQLALLPKRTLAHWANPQEKRTIVIRRFSNRQLDFDNLAGGCKGIVDALRKNKLIIDDNPKWLDAHYIQLRCRREEGHTEIDVYDGYNEELAAVAHVTKGVA